MDDRLKDKPQEIIEFVRRLRLEMAQRDWNGAEMARRTEAQLPDGSKFGRDSITRYKQGQRPRDSHILAMAAALRIRPEELFPGAWGPASPKAATRPRAPRPSQPPPQPRPPVVDGSEVLGVQVPAGTLEILGNGRVRLRIDQVVELGIAAKVLETLGAVE